MQIFHFFSAIPFKTLSFKPKFNIVSIIPGIDALAPERTDTNKGFSTSPNVFPVISSNFLDFQRFLLQFL